jgi:hypothetical protein
MAESGVIGDYLTVLSAQLPAPVVEELADGLDETCQRYRDLGLEPDAAVEAAVAEFGDPRVILTAFTRMSPARRAARRLLATGPAVGGCWGIALIASRAGSWPVPIVARLLLGIALMSVIGLLAAAAFGKKYRSVGRAGAAGCVGMTALDTAMLLIAAFAFPVVIWPTMMAAAASTIRLTFTIRTLRPLLTL